MNLLENPDSSTEPSTEIVNSSTEIVNTSTEKTNQKKTQILLVISLVGVKSKKIRLKLIV